MEKPYKKLAVWGVAYSFVLEVYRVTQRFPQDEKFGIVSQLRRAAVSVAANIVEGQAKPTKKDFLRYLYIARGSLTECEFFLELTKDLGLLDGVSYEQLEALRGRTGYLLHRLIDSLRNP